MQVARIISRPDTTSGQQVDPPLVYVCLMSQYTIASAQVIYSISRNIQSIKVIAISSQEVKQPTNRFEEVLKRWGVSLTILGNTDVNPFPAESLQKSRKWMADNLAPLLKEEKDNDNTTRFFANITGSTKAASMALNSCWEWDERHYTAEGTRCLLNVDGHPSGTEVFYIDPLEIEDEIRLLNEKVETTESEQPRDKKKEIIEAAQYILHDYEQGMEYSVLSKFEDCLISLWFKGEKSFDARCGIQVKGKKRCFPKFGQV